MIRESKVDIVVGGQFGDEGKGASAAMLHIENNYGFSVRTGGAQAEHRFKHRNKSYRLRVLPSVTALDKSVTALIAAGAIVRLDFLRDEIKRYKPKSVIIDYNTAIVEQNSKTASKKSNSNGRGGYSLGISQTFWQKMKRDPENLPIASKYVNELAEMGVSIGNVSHIIQQRLNMGERGILEGTQGALLSLNHGYYPYTTSYDVTIPAVISQAGIGIHDVGKTYMVVKAYPTRVAGNSGHAGAPETSFEALGRPLQYQSAEDGSHDGEERVFEWSWKDFETALRLNTPDRIVFTFADWLTEDKVEEMIANIEECGVDVEYIRFGEDVWDYVRFQKSVIHDEIPKR